jgi:hypothetical protein
VLRLAYAEADRSVRCIGLEAVEQLAQLFEGGGSQLVEKWIHGRAEVWNGGAIISPAPLQRLGSWVHQGAERRVVFGADCQTKKFDIDSFINESAAWSKFDTILRLITRIFISNGYASYAIRLRESQ